MECGEQGWLHLAFPPIPLSPAPVGCTYCAPPVNKLSPEVIEACSSEFFKAYTFSKCNLDVGCAALCSPASHWPLG